MQQIVKHGCERQEGKGGRGVGVRHLFQLPACSPFLDLETSVPLKLELCPWALANMAECPTLQNPGITYDPFK